MATRKLRKAGLSVQFVKNCVNCIVTSSTVNDSTWETNKSQIETDKAGLMNRHPETLKLMENYAAPQNSNSWARNK